MRPEVEVGDAETPGRRDQPSWEQGKVREMASEA